MSRGDQLARADVLAALVRELRQSNGLGASYFRAAATKLGMTVTDLQVLDILANIGPTTAGQLADLTGLTTGAITGMLKRLEESELVRRERDPADGRRVIVRLVPDNDDTRASRAIFADLEHTWHAMASQYDDAQLAFLVEFLQRSNAQTQQELLNVQSAGMGDTFSAPLGEQTSGRLVVAGFAKLTLRADSSVTDLYQARFEGPVPDVKVNDEAVTIRYPRRLWGVGGKQRAADVALSTALPWQIVILGGAAEITAELGQADLAGLELKGGVNSIRLTLPAPQRVVPISISGGASSITVHRPVGVAARVHLKGWVSSFIFDEQTFNTMGSDVRLQSDGYEATAPYYDIEVASSASTITITTI